MIIPIISLWQPHAALIRPEEGFKHLETRSWETAHRGWIAIHAAKKWTAQEKGICLTEPFKSMLRYGTDQALTLSLGAVVSVAYLYDCHSTQFDYYHAKRFRESNEFAFGNYAPFRKAWVLENIHVLPDPIPLRGQRGLWTADLPVEDFIKGRAA